AARGDECAAQPSIERDVRDEADEMDEHLRAKSGAHGDEHGEGRDDDRALIDRFVLSGRAKPVGCRRVRLLDEIVEGRRNWECGLGCRGAIEMSHRPWNIYWRP